MQRIGVDLPEPEGPQTTTRSQKTWVYFFENLKSPNHLQTPDISMIGFEVCSFMTKRILVLNS